jgi:hypothetical protein
MSKRSRRLAKKNELRTVEEAIGASLGKKPRAVVEGEELRGTSEKRRKREAGPGARLRSD